MTTTLSWGRALEAGLGRGWHGGHDVPGGTWTGRLDFASDEAASGDRYLLTVGRTRGGSVDWPAAGPVPPAGRTGGSVGGGSSAEGAS